MRLIGIDYGQKRVGIASTDESGMFSIPRAVLENNKELVNKIVSMKEEEEVEKVILGESRNYSGTANPIMAEILEFKSKLEEKGIEVVLHPELMTSVEAQHLQGDNDMNDASAASLILKNYIDSQEQQFS